MKPSSISKFVFLLSVSILCLSFVIQDIPIPGNNEVAVGDTRVSLVDRELVVDYELRFGRNVANCDVDVIVLVDGTPYRFTKYYSGDYGRLSQPGSKQLRLRVTPQKELLSGRDIRFRIDISRKELKDGRVVESALASAMPEVQTAMTAVSGSHSVTCGGRVVSDGGSAVTARGIVWSTEPNPTVKLDTKTNAGNGVGEFECTLTNLALGKRYYVRAYAKNSTGTAYGAEYSFTTKADKPSVQTAGFSGVTQSTAMLNGTVVSDGGEAVSECGFYWSATPIRDGFSATKSSASRKGASFSLALSSLEPSTEYYYQAYVVNSSGESKGEVRKFTTNLDYSNMTVVDLSIRGTANCYIVSEGGLYKFPAVKGNSREPVGSLASADVLWETFGTDKAPNVGDLVRNVTLDDGFIVFQVPAPYCKGNAVIAARNAGGEILWSWHIWLTDEPAAQEYFNNAGVMMDRNLGATSATPGKVEALGLLYQWGRKDPFLGSASISDNYEAKSTILWPVPVESSPNTGTIAFATAHPTTFISGKRKANHDWCYKPGDNSRWQPYKTIYDPCPAGWRVPDGGSNGVWSKAFGGSSYWITSSNWDSTNRGMDFARTDRRLGYSVPIWYPASGYRNDYSGALFSVGSNGYYWSVSPYGNGAYSLYFYDDGYVYPASDYYRAYGQSVRCLQE